MRGRRERAGVDRAERADRHVVLDDDAPELRHARGRLPLARGPPEAGVTDDAPAPTTTRAPSTTRGPRTALGATTHPAPMTGGVVGHDAPRRAGRPSPTWRARAPRRRRPASSGGAERARRREAPRRAARPPRAPRGSERAQAAARGPRAGAADRRDRAGATRAGQGRGPPSARASTSSVSPRRRTTPSQRHGCAAPSGLGAGAGRGRRAGRRWPARRPRRRRAAPPPLAIWMTRSVRSRSPRENATVARSTMRS